MKEIWKDVEGYDGIYQISNHGRVKSLYQNKDANGKILLKRVHRGYELVGLWKNGKVKRAKVHRLVAEAFIPNPGNLPFINHKNEMKSDNRAINLEWCTPKYNSNYGDAIDKRMRTLRKNGKPFLCIETGETYTLASDCAKELGCKVHSVYDVLRGKQKTCNGYHVKYI